eukprot:11244847-Karenia_brevis.AAC.1
MTSRKGPLGRESLTIASEKQIGRLDSPRKNSIVRDSGGVAHLKLGNVDAKEHTFGQKVPAVKPRWIVAC